MHTHRQRAVLHQTLAATVANFPKPAGLKSSSLLSCTHNTTASRLIRPAHARRRPSCKLAGDTAS